MELVFILSNPNVCIAMFFLLKNSTKKPIVLEFSGNVYKFFKNISHVIVFDVEQKLCKVFLKLCFAKC